MHAFPVSFDHQSSTCDTVPRSRPGYGRCLRCGTLGSENVHETTYYGKGSCPWQIFIYAVLLLWQSLRKTELEKAVPGLAGISIAKHLGLPLSVWDRQDARHWYTKEDISISNGLICLSCSRIPSSRRFTIASLFPLQKIWPTSSPSLSSG